MKSYKKSPLKRCLRSVEDPRINRTKKHNLIDILVSTVCAVLAGMDSWVDIVDWCEENTSWLESFLELPAGIPSHDTYARVFSLIDPREFEDAFKEWVKVTQEHLPAREIVSIDGKQTRGSKRPGMIQQRSVLTVGAWAHELGISLGHVSSRNEKEKGEKKTMELLIDGLMLENTIVTIDANGSTPTIFNKVRAKKADIVVGLKKNQKGMLNLAQSLFIKNEEFGMQSFETKEKGHGREEKRKFDLICLESASTEGWRQKVQECKSRFNGLKSLGRLTSQTKRDGKTSIEVRYYYSTLENVKEFSRAVRAHWGIENKLHWRLDVVFKEDLSRARIGHSSENLGSVRRLTMNMLKKDKTSNKSIRRKRNLCNWRPEYLEKILFG